MSWVILAFISAVMLGFYEVSKKMALRDNDVMKVLAISNAVSAVIFLPFVLNAVLGCSWFEGSIFQIELGSLREHLLVFVKAIIVLTSWICGYNGLKRTPISIYGPINSSRPVFVLLGAIILFGERLNWIQWLGVGLSFFSLYMLGITSKKSDGIDFKHNKGIWFVAAGTLLGAVSALYDRFLMRQMSSVFVQSWFAFYNAICMVVVLLVYLWVNKEPSKSTKLQFHWSWAIPAIAIFVSLADFAYFYSLSDSQSMVSIVSMIRRGSVVISFISASFIFHEKNLRTKALDLILLFVAMILLFIGS